MRDANNDSVKRSRENAKRKREQYASECKRREDENAELAGQLERLHQEAKFLNKVLFTPESLTYEEQGMLHNLIAEDVAGSNSSSQQ
jgi:hypothetical protein